MKILFILKISILILSGIISVLSYSYPKFDGTPDRIFGVTITVCVILLNIMVWLP